MNPSKTLDTSGKAKARLQTLHAAREYKPYPRYKDSGVEWLGEIPIEWKAMQLRRIGKFSKGTGGPKSEETSSGIPCIRYGDLYTSHEFFVEQSRSFVSRDRSSSYTPMRKGDILFAASGETLEEIGKSAVNLIESEACCGGDVIILRPEAKVGFRFWGYAMNCFSIILQKACMGRGNTVMHIYPQQLKYVWVAFPPYPEQVMIENFLDRETAKIDALIEKKEQLIELLKERRTALITRAVTKGLNPNAPMKDSGVEWLGDIPKEWGVKRLKYIATIRKDKFQTKPDNVTYIGLEHVESWTGKLFCDDQPGSVESSVTPFHSGDILIGKLRPYLAKAACPDFDGVCTSEILVFSTRKTHSPDYLKFCFLASSYIDWLNSNTYGTKMPRVDPSKLENSLMPTPILSQQRMIVRFLDRETAKIDMLFEKTREAIGRLKEFRTALISSAVTGKINVFDDAA